MKELDCNYMENVHGGSASSDAAGFVLACAGGAAITAVSTAAAAITGGLLGWTVLLAMGATVASCTAAANSLAD